MTLFVEWSLSFKIHLLLWERHCSPQMQKNNKMCQKSSLHFTKQAPRCHNKQPFLQFEIRWPPVLITRCFICQHNMRNLMKLAGFEVPAAVSRQITLFCYAKPCSPVNANGRFGGTNCLLRHSSSFPENGNSKHRLTFTWLHAVISQKIELFAWNMLRICWMYFIYMSP
jgi:hypothetical protein